jgi:WhiB family redox-sensing transcriptional regulator
MFVAGAAQIEATLICVGCPVQLECLADALDTRNGYGVWGGLTERQRRALLKKNPEVTSWYDVLRGAQCSGSTFTGINAASAQGLANAS